MDILTATAAWAILLPILGVVISMILLWLVIRSAVLSALTRHQKDLDEAKYRN